MKLLIIDTETTGLTEKYQLLEVGCILYSVEQRTSLLQFSTLFPVQENLAEDVNKIPASATSEVPHNIITTGLISYLLTSADYLVAHNAEFDRKALAQRFDEALTAKWLCTMNDFEWPVRTHGKRLIDIALAYNVPIVDAHRALTDCRLLAAIFDRELTLEQLIEDALLPKQIYVANIPIERRHAAKAHGFSWNSLVPNKWAKRMNEKQLENLPFSTSPYLITGEKI